MQEKIKILVADTSRLMLSTIKGIFDRNQPDYSVFIATEGKEACQKALNIKPDLILLDSELPILDVERVVRILKRVAKTRNIPIVLMSNSQQIDSLFDAGVDDFIFKPFEEKEFLYRIKCALRLGRNLNKMMEQNELMAIQAKEMQRQYRMMEEQKKDIIDDITYSRRIQNAIMPERSYLLTLLPEYFLFYKPKRIVSGDFYWVAQKDNKVILAAADCTGHGISGAFLTIAGTAFLNEIINYSFIDAAEILNHLRNHVMRLLHQKGLEGEAADGMDISLCIFDFQQMEVQYAGANNSIMQVKKNKELLVYSPDKMPIGIHENYDKPFKNQLIKLEKGDMIYMYTDGYADQFGGPLDQKFRNKRLQRLCLEASGLSMAEQYQLFERTIDEWIGYRDQIDDMLVIGIRV
ncbi:MAG TPA: SpoIIE family protein phosphatase [Bacteroidales bacterium]|nr:SpoIIE family protein phosphatase [Bacteroidales bacterium]